MLSVTTLAFAFAFTFALPIDSIDNELSYFDDTGDRCTSIGVGASATADGST